MSIVTDANIKVIFGTRDILNRTGARKNVQGVIQFTEVDLAAGEIST